MASGLEILSNGVLFVQYASNINARAPEHLCTSPGMFSVFCSKPKKTEQSNFMSS